MPIMLQCANYRMNEAPAWPWFLGGDSMPGLEDVCNLYMEDVAGMPIISRPRRTVRSIVNVGLLLLQGLRDLEVICLELCYLQPTLQSRPRTPMPSIRFVSSPKKSDHVQDRLGDGHLILQRAFVRNLFMEDAEEMLITLNRKRIAKLDVEVNRNRFVLFF